MTSSPRLNAKLHPTIRRLGRELVHKPCGKSSLVLVLALVLALALPLMSQPAVAAGPTTAAPSTGAIKRGYILPDMKIQGQPSPQHAAYLGLPLGVTSFRLSQIKAELVLVEIFSMYCPRCQAAAPKLNRVFERLKASPLGASLKFVALGAGNTPFEVDYFCKKYHASMPMFPDTDYTLHATFGNVGTPAFFVLRALPGGKGLKVLFVYEGQPESEDAFFEQIRHAATQQD
ncbi:TlpA family protein disulfide reductase [Humidesulfovibrio sp.]